MIKRENISSMHVVILGASGHARVIADIVRCAGDIVEGFLDDRDASAFPEIRMLGKISDVEQIHTENPDYMFIVGIGRYEARVTIVDKHPNLPFYTAIHPSSVIASDCKIGTGTVIMANAVVNTGTTIGIHSIINTGATVDHDCMIADYVHISPGAHVSGTVEIGKGTWISVGACIVNNVSVCPECVIGAGAVVLKSIGVAGTYVGIPAKRTGIL